MQSKLVLPNDNEKLEKTQCSGYGFLLSRTVFGLQDCKSLMAQVGT